MQCSNKEIGCERESSYMVKMQLWKINNEAKDRMVEQVEIDLCRECGESWIEDARTNGGETTALNHVEGCGYLKAAPCDCL